jgi:hypothetical protein
VTTSPDKIQSFADPTEAFADAIKYATFHNTDTYRLLSMNFGEHADGGFYWSMDFGSSYINGRRGQSDVDTPDRRIKEIIRAFREMFLVTRR